MKIAITGHTSGFGAVVFAECQRRGIECVGFSRSTGYDITNPASRKNIIISAADCDVFVNNAYDGYGQVDMLYDIYQAWSTQSRQIITIGSYAANAAEWRLKPCPYSAIKRMLDTVTYQLINSHHRECAVSILKPGYMGREHPLTFEAVGERLFEMIDRPGQVTEMVVR